MTTDLQHAQPCPPIVGIPADPTLTARPSSLGATAQRSFAMPSCKPANLIWDGNAALRNSGGLH